MHYIENHAPFNLGLMCNEVFSWLAFDSVSYNRPSHVQTREKAELELLTGTFTKPVDRCKWNSLFAVSIFRLFKGVYFKTTTGLLVSVLNWLKVKLLIRIFTYVSNWKFKPTLAFLSPAKNYWSKTLSRNQLKNSVAEWNVTFGHWRWRRFFLAVYPPLIIFIALRFKIIFHFARYCVNRNQLKRHVGFVTEHTYFLQVMNNTSLGCSPLNGWRTTTKRSRDIESLIAEEVSLMSANAI